MAKKLAIAAVLVAGVAGLCWFLFQGDGSPGQLEGGSQDSAAVPPSDADSKALPANTEDQVAAVADIPATIEYTIDLGAGTAGISGTVRSPEGATVADTTVTLYRADLPESIENEGGLPMWNLFSWRGTSEPLHQRYDDALDSVARVTTNENGDYVFEGVSSGAYLVAARGSADTLVTPSREVSYLRDTTERVDISVQPAGTVHGTVVDPDGNPVADAEVAVSGLFWRQTQRMQDAYIPSQQFLIYLLNPIEESVEAGSTGEFTLAGLPPMSYRVSAGADPWAQGEAIEEILDTTRVDLVLNRAGTLEGWVEDDRGQPLAGAAVTIRESFDMRRGFARMMDRGMSEPVEVTTDANGRFSVGRLTPGDYTVSSQLAGYRAAEARGVDVAAGESSEVVLTAETAGVITGVVRTQQGKPIADVEVRPRSANGNDWRRGRRGGGPWGGRGSQNTRTNERGEFRLDTLSVGDYDIEFRHEEWARQTVTAATGGDPLDVALEAGLVVQGFVVDAEGQPIPQARVQLQQGRRDRRRTETDAQGQFRIAGLGEDECDLEISSRGYLDHKAPVDPLQGELGQIEMGKAIVLAGVVLDPDGNLLAGARVRAQAEQPEDDRDQMREGRRGGRDRGRAGRGDRGGRPRFGGRFGRTASAGDWTDAEGRFEVQLPQGDGDWSVTASYRGLVDGKIEGLRVTGADIDGLSINLDRGALIQGKITAPGGAPVANANVTLRNNDSRGWRGMPGVARSDVDGYYQLPGLDAGSFELRVQAEGFANFESELEIDARRSVPFDVVLERETILLGQVLDEAGNPVPSARVRVRADEGRNRFGRGDVNGAFEVGGLGRGLVDVTVDAEGFETWRGTEIDPTQGALSVVMIQAYNFVGVVIDQETGEPVANATVSARSTAEPTREERETRRWRGGGGRARTNTDGEFELDDLAAGEYTLEVRAENYITTETDALPIPGVNGDDSITIELRSGGRIRGKIQSKSGAPIGNVRIRVYTLSTTEESDSTSSNGSSRRAQRGPRSIARGNSEDDGSFLVAGIPDGKIRVTFEHTEFVTATLDEVEIEQSSGTKELNPVLDSGGEISGRARGVDANSPGIVRLRGGDPEVTRFHDLEEGLEFRFRGLAEGDYTLTHMTSFRRGETLSETPIELGKRQRKRVDLPEPSL